MTNFSKNRVLLAVAVSFGCVLVGGVAQSLAGPLAITNFAYNNGFGPDAGRWHGSVAVVGAAFGDTVSAEVDWAVFEPGDFQLYLNSQAIAQIDPSGPNELIYVYQIHSITNASPGIDTLTVGVDFVDPRGTLSAPTFVLTGAATEKSPTGGGDNNTSMAWFFEGSELAVGDTSSLLVFTSPNAPEFGFLSVQSGLGGPPVSPLVASPGSLLAEPGVPEPSTMVLAFACVVPFLAHRRLR